METAVVLGVVIPATAVVVAVLVWALSRLWNRIDRVEARIDALDAKIGNKFDALRGEMERTNRTLIAFANHRHDVDGNTVFSLPADA